jgi:hypothetical protein
VKVNNSIGNLIDFVRLQMELKRVILPAEELRALELMLTGASDAYTNQKAWSMAMTQYTEDVVETFDQWEQERIALQEFYELSHEQDRLLSHLYKNWKPIRTFFKKHEFTDSAKVAESVRALDKWVDEVDGVQEAAKTANAIKKVGQMNFLDLLGSVKNDNKEHKT